MGDISIRVRQVFYCDLSLLFHDGIDDNCRERFVSDRIGQFGRDERANPADTTCWEEEWISPVSHSALVSRGWAEGQSRSVGESSITVRCTSDELRDRVSEILDEADRIDEADDEQYGPTDRGDELPDELRDPEQRRQLIQELVDQHFEQEIPTTDETEERQTNEDGSDSTDSSDGDRKQRHPDQTELPTDTQGNTSTRKGVLISTRHNRSQGGNANWIEALYYYDVSASDVTADRTEEHSLVSLLEHCIEWILGKTRSRQIGATLKTAATSVSNLLVIEGLDRRTVNTMAAR